MTSRADLNAERIVLDALGAALSMLAARVPASSQVRLAIAYSGGLDSSVLLDAAVRVAGASRCIALHVHHGLSPNAGYWSAHCESVARRNGVTFDAQRVNVPLRHKAGVEAAARTARYRALETMCATHRAQSLWLAHHADDQAETVLLQLLRGAGLAGLAAMSPLHLCENHVLNHVPRVRPLLGLSREQLEHYARARGLHWIDDESNADPRYARNALRHTVMPVLAVHFPGFRDAFARTATHAASAQRLLDDLARMDLRAAGCDDASARGLDLDTLLALDDVRALNLLRYWMRMLGLPAASAARISEVLRQLREVRNAQNDHRLCISHAGQRLRCYHGQVFWESREKDERDKKDKGDDGSDGNDAHERDSSSVVQDIATRMWRGEEIWRLPQWQGTFVFAPAGAHDKDALPETVLSRAPLIVRARSGGERMRDVPGGPSRTLKNLFQARSIPAWARDVPLLLSDETLLFVPWIGVNHAVNAGAGADESWRCIKWQEDRLIA